MSLEELKKLVEAKKSPVTVVNRGVTPLSLLGIAFIVLKVMGYITWSWWWVLAPFWIPFCLVAFLVIATIIGLIVLTYKEVKKKEKEEVKEEVVDKKEAPKKTTRKRKSKKDVEDGGVKGKNE